MMQPIVLTTQDNIIDSPSHTYRVKGNRTVNHWPKKHGKRLGQCGCWNFLWRLAYHPKQITPELLPPPQQNQLLFVDKITAFDHATQIVLQKWLQQGGKIIATGELTSWQAFLPPEYEWQTSSCDNPYAGLAYLIDDQVQFIAPQDWTFIRYQQKQLANHNQNTRFFGHLAAVQGERQTPARAQLKMYHDAPAIIQHDQFYYLNGQVFAAFQSWLQGQEDLSPWLAWRHRLFWLDEWISFLYDLLLKIGVFSSTHARPGIASLDHTTIILRHDLDYSRDTTFLSEENKRHLAATYAVLKDNNTQFWVKHLQQQPHEIAFHYNTGKRNWVALFHRYFTKKNRLPFLPHPRQITGKGLLKQIKWAKKHGIHSHTIHRHLCYLIYPEWIDALDNLFESDSTILGSSSLFRGHILRWGMDRIDGHNGYFADWPDAQFPVWYPFKLAHAGNSGKILSGWEMTSFMEIEPDMLVQVLDYKIKHLRQNIFTLIFHPAHTLQSPLYKNGSLNHFKMILDLIAQRNIQIMPMVNVLKQANESMETTKC